MITQIVNIGGGVLLSSSLIKEKLNNQNVNNFFTNLTLHEAKIGIVVLVLGLLALIERLGIVYFGLPLGSSYPQAIPAILMGLILGEPLLSRYAVLKSIITSLVPHRTLIGILGVLCGLGSLLFGCILPVVCRTPFGF